MSPYQKGFEDGSNHRPYNNPYKENSTAYVEYDSGYNNGQLVGDIQ